MTFMLAISSSSPLFVSVGSVLQIPVELPLTLTLILTLTLP